MFSSPSNIFDEDENGPGVYYSPCNGIAAMWIYSQEVLGFLLLNWTDKKYWWQNEVKSIMLEQYWAKSQYLEEELS